jgi:energy-converting hydrogenase Eha subunit A
MSDVRGPADNTPRSPQATFKVSDRTSQPGAPLPPGAFQADLEGLESFEDELGHAPSPPGQPAVPPAPKSAPKPKPAQAPAAAAPEEPRSRSASVLWPTLLIAAGAVLLLTNLGYLPQISWDQLWRFWPVLLIAIGIDTLFSRRSLFGAIVGALLILALLGGVIYVLAFAR